MKDKLYKLGIELLCDCIVVPFIIIFAYFIKCMFL